MAAVQLHGAKHCREDGAKEMFHENKNLFIICPINSKLANLRLCQRKLRAVNDQARLSCGLVSNSDPLQESKQLKTIQHQAHVFNKKEKSAGNKKIQNGQNHIQNTEFEGIKRKC